MKTEKEYREAKSRLITQRKMMRELQDNDAFKLIQERLQEVVEEATKDILNAQNWADYVAKKAYLDGLYSLSREMDTILLRGKQAERTLTI